MIHQLLKTLVIGTMALYRDTMMDEIMAVQRELTKPRMLMPLLPNETHYIRESMYQFNQTYRDSQPLTFQVLDGMPIRRFLPQFEPGWTMTLYFKDEYNIYPVENMKSPVPFQYPYHIEVSVIASRE